MIAVVKRACDRLSVSLTFVDEGERAPHAFLSTCIYTPVHLSIILFNISFILGTLNFVVIVTMFCLRTTCLNETDVCLPQAPI